MPFGQISLWGATVITSMLSAVPWIGNALTEFPPLILSNQVNFNYFYILHIFIVSIAVSIIFYYCYCTIMSSTTNLPTIGTTSLSTIRFSRVIDGDKSAYLSIPVNVLSFFVGLVDGYLSVVNDGKGNIRIALVVSLELKTENVNILNYIKTQLIIGRVNKYPNVNAVKFVISRVDLQELFIPLMIYHGVRFLTPTRCAQFNLVMHILTTGITGYTNIPSTVPSSAMSLVPITAIGITSLHFFASWLVGFVNADGSFHVKSNNDWCFSITQRLIPVLFDAILLYFGSKTTINVYSSGKYAKVSLSSIKDLTKVVAFFNDKSHHPLIGDKAISYNKWIDGIRSVARYKNIVHLISE